MQAVFYEKLFYSFLFSLLNDSNGKKMEKRKPIEKTKRFRTEGGQSRPKYILKYMWNFNTYIKLQTVSFSQTPCVIMRPRLPYELAGEQEFAWKL